ncbi:hypothetical protein [Cellulomonas carbonis]|uniref:Uncharacterized protein n=1 Tax=Cellulomonas carbonis T26 TaxID=947969 RepID=A0A0A0BNY0_9CELL|nr:hypothetical protein [Cellulomonas carbonis]KGM09392.1 hypothetical protein N868_02330 [Cellulomonas carbonis T26]MDT0167346.1 hypothetical protein [Actinotalea sp. AC32]GGC04593.1 hypothetical protein GCM10010972_17250 [Cellulomonas carbonis]
MFTMTELELGGFVAPGREPSADLTLRLAQRVTERLARTSEPDPVPCAARPYTGFVHRDGACRCFFGGPAPEFPPVAGPPARLPFAS